MSSEASDRSGLSLLEVMIATGILAGSAIVLSSIIGTGAKFGNRAESRMTAMVQAHSLLDETLARIAAGNSMEDYAGEIPGTPPRSFEVVVRSMPQRSSSASGSASFSNAGGASRSASQEESSMVQIDVRLFDSNGQSNRTSSKPIVHLTQIARRGPIP
ncbi:type IV pilus modification PilV family protein [Pirellulaceae bacterium SH449]